MREVVTALSQKNYLFKTLVEVDKKALGVKKKMTIYEGVDTKNYYVVIFHVVQKRRFLQSHVVNLS